MTIFVVYNIIYRKTPNIKKRSFKDEKIATKKKKKKKKKMGVTNNFKKKVLL